MKQLRKHLTYSNVVATLCLFLLLGGATAFAAGKLVKNSVGSKQLKKNAVTAAKIKKNAVTTPKVKNDAVTGAKVNESTLGTVPSAALANSIPQAEPTHFVGAPGEPAFENGSHNIPATGPIPLTPVGFYKDHEGIVHLQGVAEVGTGGTIDTLFTLPPGFRPAPGKAAIFDTKVSMIVFGGNTNIEGFDLSGKLLGGEGEAMVLEGVTFRAES